MKHLTDDQLEVSFKKAVDREREILHDIILHIREVDRRRLYAKRNHPSLFEYLKKSMGYSNGSAQRRIDAARLALDVPEVLGKIREGKINLTDIAFLQQGIRQKQNLEKIKVSPEVKLEILQKMEAATNSERVVVQVLDLPVLTKTKTHVQKDDSVRLEITLTKEDWENLKRVQELEGGNPADIFSKLLKIHLTTKDPLKKPAVRVDSLKSATTSVACGASSVRTYMPIPKRRFVFQRDRVCQIQDEHGKVCGSQYRLEIDHIKPVSLGGKDDLSNLRLVCSNHNKLLALQLLGDRVMRPYLKL